jgi:hypothetical protein
MGSTTDTGSPTVEVSRRRFAIDLTRIDILRARDHGFLATVAAKPPTDVPVPRIDESLPATLVVTVPRIDVCRAAEDDSHATFETHDARIHSARRRRRLAATVAVRRAGIHGPDKGLRSATNVPSAWQWMLLAHPASPPRPVWLRSAGRVALRASRFHPTVVSP